MHIFIALCSLPFIVNGFEKLQKFALGILILGSLYLTIKYFTRLDKKQKLFVGLLFVFAAMTPLYVYMGISNIPLNTTNRYVAWALGGVWSVYFFKTATLKQKKALFTMLMVFMFFAVYNCIQQARTIMVTLSDNGETLQSTQFSTALFIIAGALLVVFLRDKNLLLKLFSIALYALIFFVNSFLLQRGIVTVLGLLMLLVLVTTNTKYNSVMIVIASILCAAFLYIYLTVDYERITSFISATIPSRRLSFRLISVIDTIFEQNTLLLGSSFLTRVTYIQNSINTWLFTDIPTFLAGYGDDRTSFAFIGGHSEIFDTLAKHGLLGGLLLFSMLRYYYYNATQMAFFKSTVLSKQFSVIFVFIIIRSLIGTILVPIVGINMFFTLPLIFDIYYLTREDKK
ncbi:MAG: hypothetical protein IK083_00095 [Abditibacteriota bacterium]|nr:hypothetical protein [Abditibacteriota bacterium]